MLYAKVVLGLPVEGPFDYFVPLNLSKAMKVGVRVWVDFRNKKVVGYVVMLARKSRIKNIKPILEVIDDSPVLDKNALSLTNELSDYYCCCWGEAIETALPEALRKGKKLPNLRSRENSTEGNLRQSALKKESILIHGLDIGARWEIYLKEIKGALDNRMSAIVLLPDINCVLRAGELINNNLGIAPVLLYRKQHKELQEWVKVKTGNANIVLGTRSAVFAPFNNLGLVIIDEEQDSVYKQEQVPHYNAREVAFMRIGIEGAKLILGSASPSLEAFYLAKRGKIKYVLMPKKDAFPEVKIINTASTYYGRGKKNTLSGYLHDAIASILDSGGKALLFLNRLGFATFVYCRRCNAVLKCSRCSVNLVYHFKDNFLNCHYCNFKAPAPQICPVCNSDYIRYCGGGVEKIESELSRIFPQAKIKRLDDGEGADIADANIFIATKSSIAGISCDFDLIGVLSIDNCLNRIDFRAAEKTNVLLVNLARMAAKKIVIQTGLPGHHCFRALTEGDINLFYDEELKQRRQLNFPPFGNLGIIRLRGKDELRLEQTGQALFKKLRKYGRNNPVDIISVNPAQPYRLRGKFWRQVLLRSKNALRISKFIKTNLKNFSHSGIIVTVDIDPL